MIKQTFWFDRIYNALFPLSRTSSTWHFFTINDNQAEILIWQNTQCPWTHVPEHQVQYIKQPALSAAALFSVDQCHCSLFTVRLINVNVSTASKWSDQLLRRLDRLIWWPEKKLTGRICTHTQLSLLPFLFKDLLCFRANPKPKL